MPYTLKEIADAIGAELHGDPGCRVVGVASLARAGIGQLTFLSNSRMSRLLPESRASAVILTATDKPQCRTNALVRSEERRVGKECRL